MGIFFEYEDSCLRFLEDWLVFGLGIGLELVVWGWLRKIWICFRNELSFFCWDDCVLFVGKVCLSLVRSILWVIVFLWVVVKVLSLLGLV